MFLSSPEAARFGLGDEDEGEWSKLLLLLLLSFERTGGLLEFWTYERRTHHDDCFSVCFWFYPRGNE